ncbi:hypothetical protein ABZ883_32670 [Streptomyces sp. NPDC046977]|uniref:hypothetical protein n=1 Tax=Streptomyces sp. NPDC046977 TaxID=3154703 RepID=UPI0033F9C4CB
MSAAPGRTPPASEPRPEPHHPVLEEVHHVSQGSFIDNGPVRGPEAVHAVVTAARELCEFQDFAHTGDYGDNGFIEEYRTQVKGEPLHVVVTVARNSAGECEKLVVNHRPRNAMLLFSREMHRKFAGTPLAEHFLADES